MNYSLDSISGSNAGNGTSAGVGFYQNTTWFPDRSNSFNFVAEYNSDAKPVETADFAQDLLEYQLEI